MDVAKQHLEGSWRRDRFKRLHKDMGPGLDACDLDFVLVDKFPPGIVAFLDCKAPREKVTFAEVLAYNAQLVVAPVYIVEVDDPNTGPFDIYEYLGGDWQPEPPQVELVRCQHCTNWMQFRRWECGIRAAYRKRYKKMTA